MSSARTTVFVTTPLELEHVARIRSVAPDRVEVIAEPDLWPPLRYVADHKGKDGFARTAEQEARWRIHLGRAEVMWDFPPSSADGAAGLPLAPNLKWVQTTSSGVGQMVKKLGPSAASLLVTTARGVHAQPLAEFVFLALLTHVKQLDHLEREQQARRWERYCGDELAGKTLAVIGAGQVGGRIAAIGKAFGMRVLAGVRTAGKDRAAAMGVDAVYAPGRLHAMLAEADAVVLVAPHTPETDNLIDARAFGVMKEGVVFVNIGRGQCVDEAAMIAGLRSGKIVFAALDVAAVEPLPAASPLWDMPNVLISPHSASTVGRENERITEIFCHNLRCYLDGRIREMRNVLDKARMY
ncbi:MAG: D-2-hydroxyacid dehydrogenase [Alphaproteobacteria bacterium]|nr:D-2-hydroxyacid dehydrogenase [Alphaproteobacteria bacterium]